MTVHLPPTTYHLPPISCYTTSIMRKLYRVLATICASFGVGLFLGHTLGEGTSNTPLWLAGLSILSGGVLIGMGLTSGSSSTQPTTPAHTTDLE